LLSQRDHEVLLWSYDTQAAEIMRTERENVVYLPGVAIPEAIRVTTNIADLSRCQYYVISTPTQFIRSTIGTIRNTVDKNFFGDAVVISVAKGIENGTLKRISEIVEDVAGVPVGQYVALSGPSHAEEVGHGLPTAVVAASISEEKAREVQQLFSAPTFRVYSSTDVTGVELGGALKNVIALSAGISDGAGFGDNTKAALMTRGLAEISRIGVALGAEPKTFAGLSGLGDLIVTCNSRHSRNRHVGEQLGKGRALKDILGEMKMVAEGVATTQSAYELAKRMGVEMPIVQEVYQILFEGKNPLEATRALMLREMKEE
jgi:glycerol-3-phosphate dehydrogenase (NAD(P)+)